MSLKILLADDNITAQRLGTKILADAGFEVISVSNGAAAVKKIAADKPDILILDVYMPGYTGLEVCEKVRKDPPTAHVPVILTATNMEPYNQADGHRVGADGFMVKPFEASDLVAVVQKFAAKIAKPEPETQRTMKMAAVSEISDASYEEWKQAEPEQQPVAPKVEVPQEMAAAPAFMDDYAAPAPAMPVEAAAPAFAVEATPAAEESAPAFAVDAAPAHAEEPAAPAFSMHHAPAEPEPSSSHLDFLHAQAPPESAHAIDLAPALGHEAAAAPAEFEPTAVAHEEVAVTPASELETTAIETPEVSVTTDPGLVTNADEMSQFSTGFGVAHAEEIPVGVPTPEVMAASEPDPYQQTQKIEPYKEPAEMETAQIAAEPEPAHAEVESEMQRAFSVGGSGAAVAPAAVAEPEPAPEPPANAPIPDELVAQFAAELDQAHQQRSSGAVEEAASLEQSMVAAATAAMPEIDNERVVAAVDRVLERFKDSIRGELVQAIIRELKG